MEIDIKNTNGSIDSKRYRYELIEEYYLKNTEKTYKEIAKEFGVTVQYVSKVLKDLGYDGKKRREKVLDKKREKLKEEFIKLFNDTDYTIYEMADALGVKVHLISKLAVETGVRFKDHEEKRKYKLALEVKSLKDEGLTHAEVSERLGKSVSYIQQLLNYYKENKGKY